VKKGNAIELNNVFKANSFPKNAKPTKKKNADREERSANEREDEYTKGTCRTASFLERVERIESLTRKKSEAYRRAYRYLHSEGQLLRIRDQLVSPYMKSQAIRAYAEKQMRDIPNGNLYGARPALVRSVGMRGEVIFDTYFASAQKSILLEDCYGSAQLFLEAIGELAVKKKLQIRVSHDPVFPDRLDGIFFTESRRAFVCVPRTVAPTECKRVSLRRFVQVGAMKPIRGKLLFAERMRKAMRAGALEALRDVQEAHFALEACYTSAMDFAAKERFTKNFCDVLFDLKK